MDSDMSEFLSKMQQMNDDFLTSLRQILGQEFGEDSSSSDKTDQSLSALGLSASSLGSLSTLATLTDDVRTIRENTDTLVEAARLAADGGGG